MPGRGGAVRRWMEAHQVEIRRHLVGMLEDPDEAEDVLQEVWLAAHRSPPAERDGGGVRPWLYRVATNAALDRLARRRRRDCLLAGRSSELEPSRPPRPDAALGDGLRDRVRASVARLPRKQREAVWLRWLEGREYEEVAAELGTSPEAARANVYQGLRKLRAELEDLWREETGP